MNGHRHLILLTALTTTLILGGCGNRGTVRLPVHGKVRFGNGAAFNGAISFLPDGNRPGPAATTKVDKGHYQFSRADGPTAGPKKVVLRRFASGAERVRSAETAKPAQEAKAEWTLAVNVPDDGKYACDLVLDE